MFKRFVVLLAFLAAFAALGGCGGSDDKEPGRVWVISVVDPRGGNPRDYSPEAVLLYILRLRIPIYETNCATTLTGRLAFFESYGIYRYLVSERDAPALLASGLFREREPFERGREIFENDLCGWR